MLDLPRKLTVLEQQEVQCTWHSERAHAGSSKGDSCGGADGISPALLKACQGTACQGTGSEAGVERVVACFASELIRLADATIDPVDVPRDRRGSRHLRPPARVPGPQHEALQPPLGKPRLRLGRTGLGRREERAGPLGDNDDEQFNSRGVL